MSENQKGWPPPGTWPHRAADIVADQAHGKAIRLGKRYSKLLLSFNARTDDSMQEGAAGAQAEGWPRPTWPRSAQDIVADQAKNKPLKCEIYEAARRQITNLSVLKHAPAYGADVFVNKRPQMVIRKRVSYTAGRLLVNKAVFVGLHPVYVTRTGAHTNSAPVNAARMPGGDTVYIMWFIPRKQT
ncbi:hypothetical protein AG1IA_03540 [Rhizoctonia solani AG-1 IA]|uniref:Uncharacterized protein n=1 Tax=Thanatephorus cucumeris (strain AG1-IA) TaxID=983506 RepID=L8X1D6_THACA|nr:hypothetical protein AG1IA_03540 [Rhizoctonia solani AG-1 IA]